MYPVSYSNTHYDITGLVNHKLVKNTWISWERNTTFHQNKKIFNLCIILYILRNYHFVTKGLPLILFKLVLLLELFSFTFLDIFLFYTNIQLNKILLWIFNLMHVNGSNQSVLWLRYMEICLQLWSSCLLHL